MYHFFLTYTSTTKIYTFPYTTLFRSKFFKCTTWSTISPAERFLSNFSFPVAQNLQAKLQPTCEEIQAVILVLVGIKTPSTTFPTPTLKAHFIVRSLEICCSSKVM